MHDSVLVNFTSGCWWKSALYNNWFSTIEKVEETTFLSVIGYGSGYATTARAKINGSTNAFTSKNIFDVNPSKKNVFADRKCFLPSFRGARKSVIFINFRRNLWIFVDFIGIDRNRTVLPTIWTMLRHVHRFWWLHHSFWIRSY